MSSINVPDRARRTKARQFSISDLHEEAMKWFVEELKKQYPTKKVNASTLLEWMIEKTCGEYPDLRKWLEVRKELESR